MYCKPIFRDDYVTTNTNRTYSTPCLDDESKYCEICFERKNNTFLKCLVQNY